VIAGTIGLLADAADEPLEPHASGGFDTLDVRETQTYLDGSTVQHGRACATVETEQETIYVDGSTIETERVPGEHRIYTEWVADVTDAGFVCAERTHPGDPPWPFGMFRALSGQRVVPAVLYPGAFLARQRDADRSYDIWMAGRREETDDEEVNNVDISYGAEALSKDAIQAEIGVGFKTDWRSTVVSGVLYASGYVAIHTPQRWGAAQFSRFVVDEILPVAEPDTDDEEQFRQTALNGGDD
jgi:hypothetical protein